MSNWGLWGGGGYTDVLGNVPASSRGTQINRNATINTEGTWTELVASTAREYQGFVLSAVKAYGVTELRAPQIDVAVGAAGSEKFLLENITIGGINTTTASAGEHILIPVVIPAGSRVAVRYQNGEISAHLNVLIHGFSSNWLLPYGFHRATTYGADATDSGGTKVDAGAVANTEGAYVEFSASTTNPIRAITPIIFHSLDDQTIESSFLFDIAVGAAASEVVIVEDIPIVTSRVEAAGPQVTPPLPVDIPSGTRLSVRARCSVTTANSRYLDVVLLCFD